MRRESGCNACQDEYRIGSKALNTASAPLDYLSCARHIEAPKKSTATWHSNAREVVVVVNAYQAY